MSDKNKYYTPSIEEIPVGFEFESANTFMDGTVKTQEQFDNAVWEKEVCSVGDHPYINRALTGMNFQNGRCGIRVKYLDKDDIESFEFIEDTDATPIDNVEHMKFEKHRIDKNGRLMNLEFSWMWLNDQPFILLSECEENSEDDFEILFQGYCKNKSRLKLILQWTGILKS